MYVGLAGATRRQAAQRQRRPQRLSGFWFYGHEGGLQVSAAAILLVAYSSAFSRSYRYNAQAGSSAAAPARVMQEACRAALTFAQRFNAFALSGGALVALTRAWQAATEVAFSKR